jgi:hypothetical protein
MLTEDPYEMMATFHKQAAEGCLLGVTVTGDTTIPNYFLELPNRIRRRKGLPVKEQKSIKNHVLYDKLEELGEKTGWKLLVSWDQQMPYPFYEVEGKLSKILEEWQTFSEGLLEDLLN